MNLQSPYNTLRMAGVLYNALKMRFKVLRKVALKLLSLSALNNVLKCRKLQNS